MYPGATMNDGASSVRKMTSAGARRPADATWTFVYISADGAEMICTVIPLRSSNDFSNA